MFAKAIGFLLRREALRGGGYGGSLHSAGPDKFACRAHASWSLG